MTSAQTKAVDVCDSGTLNDADIAGSLDIQSTDVNAAGIVANVASDCGTSGANTFNISIPSSNISATCTATIDESSVQSFLLCRMA